MKYWDLMQLALLRAKTAREAIKVMTSLVKKYGYGSEGESFSIAEPHKTGNIYHYSQKSAWWVFNFAANYANTRYDVISKYIRKVQHELESKFISRQDSIEKLALEKHGAQRIAFLTNYSKAAGNLVYHRWLKLGNELVTKYNDGYIKEGRHITAAPYPKVWRDYIIRQNPAKHKIPKWK